MDQHQSETDTLRAIHLDQILLFGDSLTQWSFNPEIEGWGAFLSNSYVRKLDVVNRGFSGYNTEWCKHIIAPILRTVLPSPGAQIRLVTVFLGANDATLPFWPQQHVPLSAYRDNLHSIIASIRNFSSNTRILLITPPPIHEGKWQKHCGQKGRSINLSVSNTLQYRNACIEVAREAKVPLLDTWEVYFGEGATYNEEKADAVLSDGVHLANLGNRLLGHAVLAKILTEWPDLAPETLPTVMPLWDVLYGKVLPDALFP
ncbi:uncharacterized protein SPPG_03872 [Spizellomyces punctatus DAOM BR117]|uniref:SGNH hydrolase-type esterase domain-containing protein n=1 Tax=Spizellomyces punctatus (strain DAOM BR117) TaxID=645134 RepID=A0A0L0HIV6_SPIPD|nr:uncharacterized protein SPPG_03872 [Spizellomyces punctatus DAOM BR117]KND00759.1 hypothetical protein SPPG_03872 [Spizellomyces punctatus DAOM BR117]|eukprot:XP_016608798.1 hypothetical protein SPPG_03872 [Spizellomyces punctatus DAOM BR117]